MHTNPNCSTLSSHWNCVIAEAKTSCIDHDALGGSLGWATGKKQQTYKQWKGVFVGALHSEHTFLISPGARFLLFEADLAITSMSCTVVCFCQVKLQKIRKVAAAVSFLQYCLAIFVDLTGSLELNILSPWKLSCLFLDEHFGCRLQTIACLRWTGLGQIQRVSNWPDVHVQT